MHARMVDWYFGWLYITLDGWMDGCMAFVHGNGWMGGWMDVFGYVFGNLKCMIQPSITATMKYRGVGFRHQPVASAAVQGRGAGGDEAVGEEEEAGGQKISSQWDIFFDIQFVCEYSPWHFVWYLSLWKSALLGIPLSILV
jgi:hypothetical protein